MFIRGQQFFNDMRIHHVNLVLPIVLAICLLCAMTLMRNASWRDEMTFLEDMIRKSPEKPRAYYNLGCVYNGMNRYDDAISLFSRSIDLYRDHHTEDDERSRGFLYNVYFNRGLAYKATGQARLSVEDFSAAIAQNPDQYMAYMNRGVVYGASGQFGWAIDDLTMAISLQPGISDFFVYRGNIYMKSGRAELAGKDYQKACEMGSQFGCTAIELGPFRRQGRL
jgi:tetratricopeptide (TPR) repeat protein